MPFEYEFDPILPIPRDTCFFPSSSRKEIEPTKTNLLQNYVLNVDLDAGRDDYVATPTSTSCISTTLFPHPSAEQEFFTLESNSSEEHMYRKAVGPENDIDGGRANDVATPSSTTASCIPTTSFPQPSAEEEDVIIKSNTSELLRKAMGLGNDIGNYVLIQVSDSWFGHSFHLQRITLGNDRQSSERHAHLVRSCAKRHGHGAPFILNTFTSRIKFT